MKHEQTPDASIFGQEVKRCSKCSAYKPLAEFHKDKTRKDGLSASCKACKCRYRRRHYQENREVVLEQCRLYRQENREAYNERHRQYYQKNKEQMAEADRQYVLANPERRISKDAVNNAIKAGKLEPPQKCEACGAVENLHYHHDSYAPENYLKVRPLCCSCHMRWHSENEPTF